MQTGLAARAAFLAVSLMLSACGGGGGGTVATPTPTPIATTAFTTWRTDLAGKTIEAQGLGKQVAYTYDLTNRNITAVTPPQDSVASGVFTFDGNGNFAGLFIRSDVNFAGGGIFSLGDPDFKAAESSTSRVVISNPGSQAWDYQSFGVWETGLDSSSRTFGVMSVGASSPDSALPNADGATFTGKVVGSYVNPQGIGYLVLADLTVNFDLGARSLTFNSTTPQMSLNWGPNTFVDNPDLKLTNQTLTYTGASGFSGTLTTDSGLTGGSTGQFYGPSAEELGGVFFLQGSGVETYSGAYGATRP